MIIFSNKSVSKLQKRKRKMMPMGKHDLQGDDVRNWCLFCNVTYYILIQTKRCIVNGLSHKWLAPSIWYAMGNNYITHRMLIILINYNVNHNVNHMLIRLHHVRLRLTCILILEMRGESSKAPRQLRFGHMININLDI